MPKCLILELTSYQRWLQPARTLLGLDVAHEDEMLPTPGLQVPVAVAIFSDLVVGYSLLSVGNCVS